MKNSFFNRFTPKEGKFFPLLKKMSDVLLTASDLLIECLKSDSHLKKMEYYKKVKEQERIGDKYSLEVFDELNSTFITPFDREDIHALATKMEDVTDGINSCAKRIALYNPKQVSEDALKLGEVLKESVICIGKIIDQIDILKKNPQHIKIYSQELHDLENKADDIYEHAIINLFELEHDGIELIKMKEILHELEKTIDAAEGVGKVVKTIVVKYA